MRSRINVRIVLAALAIAAVVVPAAVAASSWVRWEGRYFVAWIPNDKWQVVESNATIDVSSPTGLAAVSFAYTTLGTAPYSLDYVDALSFSPQAGLRNVRIVSRGRPYSLAGGVARVTSFTATRLRDRRAVRGVQTSVVFNNSATYTFGFAGYQRVAPAREWAQWAPTLKTIQDRIVAMGRG